MLFEQVVLVSTQYVTAIKLRKKLPLGNCSCIALLTYIPVGILLDDCTDAGGRATHGAVAERVGVTTARMQEVEQRRERLPRRIKISKKALFDPLILTFSLRATGLSILAVTQHVETRGKKTSASRGNEHNEQLQVGNQHG